MEYGAKQQLLMAKTSPAVDKPFRCRCNREMKMTWRCGQLSTVGWTSTATDSTPSAVPSNARRSMVQENQVGAINARPLGVVRGVVTHRHGHQGHLPLLVTGGSNTWMVASSR